MSTGPDLANTDPAGPDPAGPDLAGPDLAALLADGTRTVLLTQAGTATEARLIRDRVAAAGGSSLTAYRLGPPGHPGNMKPLPPGLLDDPAVRLIPLRVAWLPEEHGGRRAARLADLIPGHDPYRPSERRQRRLAARQPSRAAVLAGEPATAGELRARWVKATGGTGAGPDGGFAAYVARRATLALDRAEYRLLGPRYKTPSLVKEEILASQRFRTGLAELRRGEGVAAASAQEAGQILDELVAGWSRRLIDIMPTAGRLIYSRGFDPQIDYDPAQVERLRAAMQRYPSILLWSHRSNLDTLVLAAALQENGLPPAHLFAGLNMAFGPMGAIMRRAGVIFIRRSLGDDPLYRYVLRHYVGYVIEKRFNLSWSIEGTRSRTGKMLPPRLGLLAYAADAYQEGRADDILLLPVSITFDQLHEIAEYAEYARGGAKKPEGFSWLYGFIKAQGARHYGKVYVRFGEPVSLRACLGAPGGEIASDPAARRLALQKTAFEVAWRINQNMPVTATAVVTTILLAMHGVALTFGQIRIGLADALDYLARRDIPCTASVPALAAAEPVRATLDTLRQGGLVTSAADGREPVWLIGPDQQLPATFYRNSLIHFLLDSALCELAVLRAAEAAGDPVGVFWAEIAWLRDLLKFEFYFQDSEEQRQQIREEMERNDPQWEQRLRSGPAGADALLTGMRPLVSHVVVRPFVEAYRIVADVLVNDDVPDDDADVIKRALGLGQQYVAQRRLRSSESVSVLLFQTALQLARNRRLLGDGAAAGSGAGVDSGEAVDSGKVVDSGEAAHLAARRAAFLAELRGLLLRLDQIENLAIRRYVKEAVSLGAAD